MKTQFTAVLVLCWCLTMTPGHARLFSPEAIQTATTFAQTIDRGEFAAAYESASPLLQIQHDKQDWIDQVKRHQQLLGTVNQRTLVAVRAVTTFPQLPDGDYLVVQFAAQTPLKQEAREVLLLQQQNGTWQICDYAIR